MSYDKVSLLLPMNGANNGTVFTDWSPVPKTVTRFGAVTSTAQFEYYDSSGSFSGSGQYLQVADSIDWHFAQEDFCIEAWVRPNSVSADYCVASQRATSSSDYAWTFLLTSAGVISFRFTSNGTTQVTVDFGAHGLSANTWAHVSVTRNGTGLRCFVNGIQIGSTYDIGTTSIFNSSRPLQIAALNNTVSALFGGFMQDFRITKGAALYTTNFTPPTRLIGTISNAAVGAAKILDAAGNPAERTVIAVPRSAPVRIFSDVSNSSGEFEIQAPAGVDHSVVAIADETDLYNDIVHRVIPE